MRTSRNKSKLNSIYKKPTGTLMTTERTPKKNALLMKCKIQEKKNAFKSVCLRGGCIYRISYITKKYKYKYKCIYFYFNIHTHIYFCWNKFMYSFISKRYHFNIQISLSIFLFSVPFLQAKPNQTKISLFSISIAQYVRGALK